MHPTANPLHERRIARRRRTRRRRMAAGSVVFGIVVAAALAFVYAAVLGPSLAGTAPLLAGFEARSYVPGQTATLRIAGGGTSKVTLQLYLAGAPVESGTTSLGWDRTTFGRAVTVPHGLRPVHPPSAQARHPAGARGGADKHVAGLQRDGRRQLVPQPVRPPDPPRPTLRRHRRARRPRPHRPARAVLALRPRFPALV